MNRTPLERAAAKLAAERGYAFSIAPDDRMAQAATHYPAAVLAPLRLHSTEGRTHGRRTYNMTLRLMQPAAKLPPDERNALLDRLESDLLSIFAALPSEKCVLGAEELKITPAAGTFTPHNELSQTATARIVTWF